MIAKIWKNRIIAKDQVYSECPDKYKEDVKTLLLEDVKNSVITKDTYDELINA